jgi:hypothetical protein
MKWNLLTGVTAIATNWIINNITAPDKKHVLSKIVSKPTHCNLDPCFGDWYLTLSWNECPVWRTIHKYERFLVNKARFEASSSIVVL